MAKADFRSGVLNILQGRYQTLKGYIAKQLKVLYLNGLWLAKDETVWASTCVSAI